MNLTLQAMAREAAATGFGAELLEKVFRLMALLDALNSHPFLKTRIALKGGTEPFPPRSGMPATSSPRPPSSFHLRV
jgi:hypothetical protein